MLDVKDAKFIVFGKFFLNYHTFILTSHSGFTYRLRSRCSSRRYLMGCRTYANFIYQAPVVQTLDSAIHRINHYPVDSVIGFPNTYPLDSDLSGG